MKILYDAYWWDEGPTSNREVMREILESWTRQFDDEITVFRKAPQVADSATADTAYNLSTVYSTKRPHGIAVLTDLQREAKTGKYDAVFTQNFSVRHGSSNVFIHDLLFETNPEWFGRLERLYFSLMTRTSKRAQTIFTSSQSEATRIHRVTNHHPVVPVGLGPSRQVLESTSEKPDIGVSPDQFILIVGRFNVRKNLGRSVRAALASPHVSREFPIVAVGDEWDVSRDEGLQQAISDGRLICPGFVTAGALRWLYEMCAVFVMASLGEGFGMPVAEASSLSKPIVASDLPVFQEIAEGPFWVDPYDERSITAGINDAIETRRSTRSHTDLDWDVVASKIRAQILEVVA